MAPRWAAPSSTAVASPGRTTPTGSRPSTSRMPLITASSMPSASGPQPISNARKVAEFLRKDSRVAWVNYAGFPDSPYYALVQKYLDGNGSSLFTFGIKGGMEAGKGVYDSLKLITRLVTIGEEIGR